MEDIKFKELMYGYAGESTYQASKIKVLMPDMFPDKLSDKAIEYKTNNGNSKSIIINSRNNLPPISDFTDNRNYLYLPVLNDRISTSTGDKLILGFINGNPRNGIILGKV